MENFFMKHVYWLMILVMTSFFGMFCSGGGEVNEPEKNSNPQLIQIMEITIDVATRQGVAINIDNSTDPEMAVKMWGTIHQSINETLLPLLKGEQVKFENLQEWVDIINSDKRISTDMIYIIQQAINIGISYLPPAEWDKVKKGSALTAKMLEIVQRAIESFDNAMAAVLKRYKPGTDGLLTSVNSGSGQLKFDYSK